MFERLFFNRLMVYKSSSLNDPMRPTRVKWDLIQRITNLPPEFLKSTLHPFFLSPNFEQYLDIDQQTKTFIIRGTTSQRSLYQIPEWIMNVKDKQMAEVVNRFKWRDNESFQIINNEGIEKIFSLTDNFKEVNFHVIPIYQPSWSKKKHYYYDKPQVELYDVYERLKRKYQTYKCATLMDEKNKDAILMEEINNADILDKPRLEEKLYQTISKKLYEVLYTVDYQIKNQDDQKYDRFVIEQSFTFLHWNLVEQLQRGELQVN